MKKITVLLCLLLVHLYLLTHLQFTAWPEMFSYPYLRNHGFLMYKDMIHPYTPLLTMGLSVIYFIFGYGVQVLEYTTWTLLLINSVLLFLCLKQVTKRNDLSFLGLSFYVLLQPFLEGNMLWFDTAIVTPILLSFYFLLKTYESKSLQYYFLSGLFLCIAILIKQTVGLYLLCLIPFLLLEKTSFKKWIAFLLPFPLLGIPLLIRLIQEGALQDFLNWTLVYPLLYWSRFPGYVQMDLSKKEIGILAIFLLPFFPILTNVKLLKEKRFQVIILFLLCSLVAIYPRFSFFHFQTALAFFIILAIFVVQGWKKQIIYLGSALTIGLFFLIIFKGVVTVSFDKEPRFYGGQELLLTNKIQQKIKNEDKIFLLGLPSQLYVMANSLPSKRWSDNYVWYFDIPGVQEEMLSRWADSPPKYIFRQVPKEGNWFDLGTYQPKKIVEYIKSNYNFEGELIQGVEIWQRKN